MKETNNAKTSGCVASRHGSPSRVAPIISHMVVFHTQDMAEVLCSGNDT